CPLRGCRSVAGRRVDGIARVAPWRAAARRAGLDYRRRRRRRTPRDPDRRAVRGARDGRRQPTRARPTPARGRRDCRRHRQSARSCRAHARIRRRLLSRCSDRAHRAEGNDRRFRQFIWRADAVQFPRFCRAPECANSGLLLFHIRSRGTFCAGSGVIGLAYRRRVVEAAPRRTQLARARPNRPATARPPDLWQSRIPHRLNGGEPMTIKVGDKIPSVTLRYLTPEGVRAVSSDEFFAGKKVALFAVPGAYTRTCSQRHLPGYIAHAAEIKAKGVDTMACLGVNDPFVMGAWGKEHNTEENIVMLGDGSGEFT